MLNKKIFIVAGLPRSGSTLLMNILGQNDAFFVTPTSGILDIIVYIRNSWNNNPALLATDRQSREARQIAVMRGVLQGYFSETSRPVCFDKNRLWLEYLETMAVIAGGRENVKVLVTVRDLRDVLASFEKQVRDTSALRQAPMEMADAIRFKTAVQRIQWFIDNQQPVGRAYNAIRDAVTRGWRDCMHFVEYDALTGDPEKAIDAIYDFLGEPSIRHDFDNVEQITEEDDFFHGFRDLHTIRRKVESQPPSWPTVFDQTVRATPMWKEIEKVSRFWRAYLKPLGSELPGDLPTSSNDGSSIAEAVPQQIGEGAKA
jgi:sulfotransferase